MLESSSAFGDVAQLGERLVCNQEVAGSIPVVSIQREAARKRTSLEVPPSVEHSVEELRKSARILRLFFLPRCQAHDQVLAQDLSEDRRRAKFRPLQTVRPRLGDPLCPSAYRTAIMPGRSF